MKTNYAVTAILIISFGATAVAEAQQPTNSPPGSSANPAQPPAAVVGKEPVPSPDKYPLAEAVRVLESGDPSKSTHLLCRRCLVAPNRTPLHRKCRVLLK